MEVDALQRATHAAVAELQAPDTLITWEAQDVYTAGRRTQPEDVPDSDVPVIAMDRGGSVTYHGPGQLVLYPIVKVRPPKDVVAFVRATEEAVIAAVREWGIETEQVEGRSGVWINNRKLCAIGIKFADDATMHGLALNVSTNLERFTHIVPCGIFDAGVVSLEELGVHVSLQEAADVLVRHLSAAYEQFLIPERFSPEILDAKPALRGLKDVKLSSKTGTPWHPKAPAPETAEGANPGAPESEASAASSSENEALATTPTK